VYTPIHPDTPLASILDASPNLTEALESAVPQLRFLTNPTLRKAVTANATVEWAARAGGIPVRELVRRLRDAAGPSEPAANAAAEGRPAWLTPENIQFRIDADTMLAGGVHPVGLCKEYAAQLRPGGIIELTVAFRPQPLLELMGRLGLAVFCEEQASSRHTAYFCRLGA
jgi:hypothetical protein